MGPCTDDIAETIEKHGFHPRPQVVSGLAVAPNGDVWAEVTTGSAIPAAEVLPNLPLDPPLNLSLTGNSADRGQKSPTNNQVEAMEFDVESHLRAVERTVSSLERDGRSARAVTLSRSYATTVEDLWDAVANGERIPRWFLPVSGQLEPGGRYRLEGNAGGVITACERPSRVALTWEFGGDVSGGEATVAGGADPDAARAAARRTAAFYTGEGA